MKEVNKSIKKVTKMVKRLKLKNWIFIVFVVSVFMHLLMSKKMTKYVTLVVGVSAVLNYIVTKNLTSAVGSAAVVGLACMYYKQLQENMGMMNAVVAGEHDDEN
tara:strand:+ start:321 stop:632 length:312 start_codon:yes stop_codon:yes gene_type:complete